MNAGRELLLDLFMALPASLGHVELEHRRLRVACGKNLMRPVTVGANGCLHNASANRPSMHAFLIRQERLSRKPSGLHDEFLTMTPAASRGNICMVHLRLRICGCQQLVRTSVTISASGTISPVIMIASSVQAAVVSRLLLRVTLCA